MKFRKILTTVFAFALCLCLAAGFSGCGTSTQEAETDSADEADSADEDDDTSAEMILQLDDGTEIELTQFGEDEAYIYGKFIYESDGSIWVFGGDSLSVAFYGTDGDLDLDLYDVAFYQAADEDSDYASYLYVVLTDVFEGTSACWYALNVTDDDDSLVAVALVNPSDTDVIYYLSVYEDDSEETDDEEADEE